MQTLEPEPKSMERRAFRRDAFYERTHLFVPGDNVIVAFRVRGPISEAPLRTAIQEMQHVHPMIGVHVEFDASHHAWFVSGDTSPCPLKIVPRVDDRTWLQAVLAEYLEPFDITRGPLLRFLWVRGEALSELVAFGQHAICDGLSLVYLLRDLLVRLGDPAAPLPPRDRLPTIQEVYDLSSIRINPLIRKIFGRINALWRRQQVIFTPEDFLPLHAAFQAQRVNAVTWALDRATTARLVAKCHTVGISVNSALYCAVLHVQHALQGDTPAFRRRIFLPVNLRHFVTPPIGDVVGLYAGGELLEIRVKWTREFWAQARKVHRALRKQITPASIFAQAKKMMLLEPSLMDARIMLFLGSLLPQPPAKYATLLQVVEQDRFLAKMKTKNAATPLQYGAVLTNLGAVSLPASQGPLHLEGVTFLPPSSVVGEKLLGVVTYNGALQGTIAFTEKTLDPALAARFARALETFIQAHV